MSVRQSLNHFDHGLFWLFLENLLRHYLGYAAKLGLFGYASFLPWFLAQLKTQEALAVELSLKSKVVSFIFRKFARTFECPLLSVRDANFVFFLGGLGSRREPNV